MYLDSLKIRLAEISSISSDQISPCTEEEVSSLELQLGVSLPSAYREFLLWMGHGAGQLMQGSDCFFAQLLTIQEWAKELLQENSFPEKLPDDAFVFFMHQGYQFSFLRTTEGDDPPIYYFLEDEEQTSFIKIHEHYHEFLATEIEMYAKFVAQYG